MIAGCVFKEVCKLQIVLLKGCAAMTLHLQQKNVCWVLSIHSVMSLEGNPDTLRMRAVSLLRFHFHLVFVETLMHVFFIKASFLPPILGLMLATSSKCFHLICLCVNALRRKFLIIKTHYQLWLPQGSIWDSIFVFLYVLPLGSIIVGPDIVWYTLHSNCHKIYWRICDLLATKSAKEMLHLHKISKSKG